MYLLLLIPPGDHALDSRVPGREERSLVSEAENCSSVVETQTEEEPLPQPPIQGALQVRSTQENSTPGREKGSLGSGPSPAAGLLPVTVVSPVPSW